jgi:hypothetical protein
MRDELDRDLRQSKVGQCAGREVARLVSGGAGERVAVKLQQALQRRDSSNLA